MLTTIGPSGDDVVRTCLMANDAGSNTAWFVHLSTRSAGFTSITLAAPRAEGDEEVGHVVDDLAVPPVRERNGWAATPVISRSKSSSIRTAISSRLSQASPYAGDASQFVDRQRDVLGDDPATRSGPPRRSRSLWDSKFSPAPRIQERAKRATSSVNLAATSWPLPVCRLETVTLTTLSPNFITTWSMKGPSVTG